MDEISRNSQQKKSVPISTNRTVQQTSSQIKTSSLSPTRKPTTKTYARPVKPMENQWFLFREAACFSSFEIHR